MQRGYNLLIEVRVFGNSNSNRQFTYPLDAAKATTTTRLYSGSPTASTGTLGKGYGLVMGFLDRIRRDARIVSFGGGCAGSGGPSQMVLPAAARTRMGGTNNIYGVGRANMRYQQVFSGSQVGPARQLTGHSLRMRDATYSGGSQVLEVRASQTLLSPAKITGNFSSNLTSPQTVVFKRKTYKYPR